MYNTIYELLQANQEEIEIVLKEVRAKSLNYVIDEDIKYDCPLEENFLYYKNFDYESNNQMSNDLKFTYSHRFIMTYSITDFFKYVPYSFWTDAFVMECIKSITLVLTFAEGSNHLVNYPELMRHIEDLSKILKGKDISIFNRVLLFNLQIIIKGFKGSELKNVEFELYEKSSCMFLIFCSEVNKKITLPFDDETYVKNFIDYLYDNHLFETFMSLNCDEKSSCFYNKVTYELPVMERKHIIKHYYLFFDKPGTSFPWDDARPKPTNLFQTYLFQYIVFKCNETGWTEKRSTLLKLLILEVINQTISGYYMNAFMKQSPVKDSMNINIFYFIIISDKNVYDKIMNFVFNNQKIIKHFDYDYYHNHNNHNKNKFSHVDEEIINMTIKHMYHYYERIERECSTDHVEKFYDHILFIKDTHEPNMNNKEFNRFKLRFGKYL